MFFTYIVECADKSLYVGCTNDLEKRIKQHNSSKLGAHYTKIRRPVVLKYFEKFTTLAKARKRENEIKGWKRAEKLNLVNQNKNLSEAESKKINVWKKDIQEWVWE